MYVDPEELDAVSCYKILIGTIVPRAIGWVSTVSTDGVANLAPFSFFTVVSRKPPMVSLTIQPKSDRVTLKDTLVNIRETGEFVTNLVTLPLADAMHESSKEHPAEADEFDIAGLQKAACDLVRPPRVALAPASMECRLDRIIPMGDVGDHVVFGRVVRFHFRDDIYLPGGRVDTIGLQPVGRLAAEYTLTNNIFTSPLEPAVVAEHSGRRMKRLDSKPEDWSQIDDPRWTGAGNALAEVNRS
ncbi:flavin reductase family protein [Agrobacterium tumefaciens]|uniref:flavin reductase family protein n=1 Tax=Agrobacterium fabrum TaxID=1176649 RepID=UPI00157355C4|nr:flavin reductase family protein [Agrobacterium fabrum]NTE84561.1 flavin reductase family protein [Agrobacterium tumefaciens]